MSDIVCCPLSNEGADESAAECFSEETVVAAKPHRCGECGGDIVKGERHELAKDGHWLRFRTCLLCVEIRNHFACGSGWIYMDVWNQLEENFFPEMTAGGPCMQGLSPAAKAFLFERKLKHDGFNEGG